MFSFFKRFVQSNKTVEPSVVVIEQPKPTEKVFTIDPSKAPVITLPNSFRLVHKGEYVSRWPNGFWDHLNSAENHYKQSRYTKAKDELLIAYKLKSDYERLNSLLLRTYRKLYKKAIEDNAFKEAFSLLSELLKTIPVFVTDTDRKQYNKVIQALQKIDISFKQPLLPLQGQNDQSVSAPIAEIITDNRRVFELMSAFHLN